MARKPRQLMDVPNTLYHVVCRGVNQRNIFRRARDYKKFLKILREAKRRFKFYLYVYNLLPNHSHLEIKTRDVSISKIMHFINTTYARYFNWRYNRVGHLFQDRFYSSVINTEAYFWGVGAYIDLNAWRAELTDEPENYPWSSFSVYNQKEYKDDLIDREEFLKLGGSGDTEKLRRAYVDFVKKRQRQPYKKLPKFISNERFL